VTARPPDTAQRPFVYELHGERIEDPYHWLEGSAAPELRAPDPELDAEVSAWTEAQNAHTRAVVDGRPGRAVLERELEGLLSLDSWGIPQAAGEWLFYTLRTGAAAQPVLYAQRGELGDGEPRVLLDVNALDADGRLALAWYRPSWDGRYVAFGTYRSGDENTTCRVLETATGRWLEDELTGRVDAVEWLTDHEHFVVRHLADPGNPYSGRVMLHRLGRAATADPVLFEQYTEGPLATTWGPSPIVSEDGRWLIILYYTGTASNDVWCYDLDRWRVSGGLERRDLLIGTEALTSGFIDGDTFYALTTLGASSKRVLAFDLASPEPARFRELIGARSDAVIASIAPAAGRIVVEYLVKAQTVLEVFDRHGRAEGPIRLPGIGSAAILTHPRRVEAWLRFETFGEPPAVYRVDLARRAATFWRGPELPASSAAPRGARLTVEQVSCRSADGTEVPMFIVRRADLRLDGTSPAVLYGYGGFDISLTPTFLATWRPWLVRGGVYAVANLRGGGELGADWHRAGMLERKQSTFDDFYAAAERLIAQGYTSRERLGIRGGSNGGLLTGVAITQRPELCAAAIVAVPLLDMLRYQHFLMARYWVPEYGSAEDAAQYRYLRAYSPYQNIARGTAYPAVLLTAGENDSRVHPAHARKMAAALQAATAADPARKPVLLAVERAVGHGPGKPLADRIREAADELAFMAWQLGLEIR
jgi:prolyl oligopeptidase